MSDKIARVLEPKTYWMQVGEQGYIHRFNTYIAPLLDAKNESCTTFMCAVARIETTAQLCQGDVLRRHLKYLSPDMVKSSDIYVNALLSLNRQQGNNPDLERHINNIRIAVSELKDKINRVFTGESEGADLKQLLSGEFAELVQGKRGGWEGIRADRYWVGQRATELRKLKQFKVKNWAQAIGVQIISELEAKDGRGITGEEREALHLLSYWRDDLVRLGKEISQMKKDFERYRQDFAKS